MSAQQLCATQDILLTSWPLVLSQLKPETEMSVELEIAAVEILKPLHALNV